MFRSTNRQSENYFEISSLSDQSNLPEGAWKVRPCEWYLEEYKDCKSLKAQFHQYFIFGERTDCSQWQIDYKNCLQFRKNEDTKFLEPIIESEKERAKLREDAVKLNDVWEYRDRESPPDNWNSPMPDWMLKNKENSLLIETQNKLNEGLVPATIFTGFSCTIM
ncbi:synaptic plasticity regulator PANTS [Parasteatoda tepidariorum]|nr:UPF0545 protein C22orf39 homolog [Parasteatoda tepidariorum]